MTNDTNVGARISGPDIKDYNRDNLLKYIYANDNKYMSRLVYLWFCCFKSLLIMVWRKENQARLPKTNGLLKCFLPLIDTVHYLIPASSLSYWSMALT